MPIDAGEMEGRKVCLHPLSYASITRIRFKESRPLASSQPIVPSSPKNLFTIYTILLSCCQFDTQYRFNYAMDLTV